MRSRNLFQTLLVIAAFSLVACGPGSAGRSWERGPTGDDPADPNDPTDPPLSSEAEVLPYGIPANPAPPPTDDDPPAKGYFLLNQADAAPLQSAVKSQGSRGVCTIFANVAYMEHLYLKGRRDDPAIAERIPEGIDFSEQYMQWSVKFQVNSFPYSSGSNAYYNLSSAAKYGVVLEDQWPYETSEWGASNDPACDGSGSQPTYCYTNGHPSDEVKAAPKYKLPTSRSLSARAIRNYIYENQSAVVIGVKFFYQAWNHRRTNLVRNQTHWDHGYVLYPNADDKQDSSGDRSAGHGILIVGWDDEMEVPMVDKDGLATCTDEEQTKVDPVTGVCPEESAMKTEKGFYLFKNSWGTGSFGRISGIGDGYGYIAQRYVHEYADARVTEVPDLTMMPEPETPPPPAEKSVTFTGSVAHGEMTVLEPVELGANATDIKVTMTGEGDADLYTQFGAAPDEKSYLCRPYEADSDETCEHASAPEPTAPATLYVGVYGWADGDSAYSITVTWKE